MTIHQLKSKAPTGYKFQLRGERAEIYLYGTIGDSFFGDGITAKQFVDDLKKAGNVSAIDLRINSEGGDVMQARAIYTMLVEHKADITVHIDGLAASAASFIAMAGNEILIAEGGFLMIHNAWTVAIGGADDMRRTADLLETVNSTIAETYVARTKNTSAQIKEWMDAETWMTGKEAVSNGFADQIVENLRVAASVRDPSKFKNLPNVLRPNRAAAIAALESMKDFMR